MQWTGLELNYLAKMKLPIKPLSQRDESIRRFKLGNGSGTIGGWGCVLVCVNMALQYWGKDIFPLALNKALRGVNGWVGKTQNLMDWKAITRLYGDITYEGAKYYNTTSANLSILNDQLEKKQPVILKVEADEIGTPKGTHFVLCIGKDGDDYWINDPWFGDTVRLGDRYKHLGSSKPEHIILGYRILEGPLDAAPEDKDAERAVEELKNYLPKYKKKKGESGAKLESMVRFFVGQDKADIEVKKECEGVLKEQKALHIKELKERDSVWQGRVTSANQKVETARKDALQQAEPKVLFGHFVKALFGISEKTEKKEVEIIDPKGGEKDNASNEK